MSVLQAGPDHDWPAPDISFPSAVLPDRNAGTPMAVDLTTAGTGLDPSDASFGARAHLLIRSAQFTAIAGIAYAILFIASFWLLTGVPNADSSSQEIIDYYQSTDASAVTIVALYLLPFAGIAFLWFVVSLRMWITYRAERPASVLFSNIQLVSGIVFLSLFFASAAALSVNALAADAGNLAVGPVAATEFPEFGSSLFFVFAIRMGAMFVFTTTNIGRGSKILPNWFAAIGLVVGLVMLLSASFNRALIMVFPAWVLLLCVLILIHARKSMVRIKSIPSVTEKAPDTADEAAPTVPRTGPA
jgi:hypothetical protein